MMLPSLVNSDCFRQTVADPRVDVLTLGHVLDVDDHALRVADTARRLVRAIRVLPLFDEDVEVGGDEYLVQSVLLLLGDEAGELNGSGRAAVIPRHEVERDHVIAGGARIVDVRVPHVAVRQQQRVLEVRHGADSE